MKIVLFRSLRNSKRRNKGNFASKSNSKLIKQDNVVWGWGETLQFLSELNNIFQIKVFDLETNYQTKKITI